MNSFVRVHASAGGPIDALVWVGRHFWRLIRFPLRLLYWLLLLPHQFNTFGLPVGGGLGGFPMMGAPAAPQGPFKSTYRCYPVVMLGSTKAELEKGDKIILPASALDTLARLRVTYPMMFSLVNPKRPRELRTHSGVMEFSAEEGRCYIPYWMMQNLLIESGGLLEVTNVSLRKGTYVKLQPHSVKFTQLHNPRVVCVPNRHAAMRSAGSSGRLLARSLLLVADDSRLLSFLSPFF